MSGGGGKNVSSFWSNSLLMAMQLVAIKMTSFVQLIGLD